jgi:hypothetical protein
LWCEGVAFDRIQVNALVRIVTAAAGMVEVCVPSMSGLSSWKTNPTLIVGQGFGASVFFRQHDRQHAGDDGLSIWALDIWLLIQVDLAFKITLTAVNLRASDLKPSPTPLGAFLCHACLPMSFGGI